MRDEGKQDKRALLIIFMWDPLCFVCYIKTPQEESLKDHTIFQPTISHENATTGVNERSDTNLTLLVIILLEELLVDEFPQNGKHETLHAVRDNLRLETAAEETADAILLDDTAESFRVAHILSIRLLVDLDDADRV
jgi:hypothetical protein